MGSRSRDGAEAVRRMVAAHLPGYRVDSVVRVGEGTDNLVFEVNGELLVRWTKEADPAARAARVEREARLLAAVADISPLPVPNRALSTLSRDALRTASSRAGRCWTCPTRSGPNTAARSRPRSASC